MGEWYDTGGSLGGRASLKEAGERRKGAKEWTKLAQQTERRLSTDAELDATQRWLAAHPEVLEGFDDEWVAVADERVIAHGQSVVDVAAEARRQGYDDPLLVPIMPSPWV